MVPAGDPTRATVKELAALLGEGDVVVDGGNSRWTDDIANAELLAEKGIGFVDCGVSGGVWGLENGYALMYGGDDDDIAKVQPAFDALKPEGEFGSVHAGKVGAGHFSKMVHNGIEYAIMQAYAEGWELLEEVDLIDNVTEVFAPGARARSSAPGCSTSWSPRSTTTRPRQDRRLRRGLRRGPLDRRGRHRPRRRRRPPITAALFARFVSRQDDSPAMKAIAAMRNQFGGHAVHRHRGAAPAATPRPKKLPAAEPESCPVHVSHLALHDFRSYADVDVALEPGVDGVHRPQRPGQDQPRRGDRLPLPALLAPRRDRRAAGAGRCRPGDRPRVRGEGGTYRRCSRSSSTPGGPTAPGSTARRSRGPARSSAWCARWSSHPTT